MGVRMTKGILLTGPPGIGKTHLAKALAGESNCKFYFTSSSQTQSNIVGLESKIIEEMFKEARKNSPSIIFIDEIDSLATKRMKNDNSINV